MKHLARVRAFAVASPVLVFAAALALGGGGCSSPDQGGHFSSLSAALGADVTAGLVISQVYGGGGNTGATYSSDFVELFNAGTAALSVGGMSVQYASASSGTWKVTALSTRTIPAGGYYLVAMTVGGSGAALPTPDDTGTTDLAETGGKVALVVGTTPLACTTSGMPNACVASTVDLVGYGNSLDYAGSGPTGALSATTAALRGAAGCTDTGDNKNDFAEAAASPRNSAIAVMICGGAPPSDAGADSGADGSSASDSGADGGSSASDGGVAGDSGGSGTPADSGSGDDAGSDDTGDDDDDDDELGNPDAGNNSGIVPISDANSSSCSSVGSTRGGREETGAALSFGLLSLVTFGVSRRGRRTGRRAEGALRKLP